MISCRKASLWTSQELDTELPAFKRALLSLHRALCPSCRRFAGQIDRVEQAFRAWISGPTRVSHRMSPETRERIRSFLQSNQ